MGYRKMAFFVEGYTEQQFVKRLLNGIFDSKSLSIDIKDIKGGNSTAISYTTIETSITTEETKYYVLIYNCNGDGAIRSYIEENREGLIREGYEKVIGLRDIYPDFNRSEINDLLMGLNYKLPQKDLPIKFVLSIMEVEGWFLADENHYSIIDSKLSIQNILKQFNFDPSIFDTQLIDEPAIILASIYKLVGKNYKKTAKSIDRTINALDIANLYFNVQNRNSSLKELISEFETVFV
jgi:hypothetical protein